MMMRARPTQYLLYITSGETFQKAPKNVCRSPVKAQMVGQYGLRSSGMPDTISVLKEFAVNVKTGGAQFLTIYTTAQQVKATMMMWSAKISQEKEISMCIAGT